jgi:pimeloyl-ACP methyl ester carboxylesterase/DNA-binding CsgD family transcriptional regulator
MAPNAAQPASPPSQRIRYVRASDGVQLAWADASSGPVLVKAANWLTHLEDEWDNPVWRHWIRFLCRHFRLVRYDERGCGMSDWEADDLTLERRVEDLEAVVAAAGLTEPFALLGISQGGATCVAFAARHPERVSHLVLYGAYARGIARRGNPEAERTFQAIVDLARFGWGQDNPAFRQVFTSRFLPGGTDEQIGWFNELCRKTTSPRMAAALMESRMVVDATSYLEKVRSPTLVLHARNDQVVPLAEGRLFASGIPGAQFVELDSKNHILLANEPAWERFQRAILEFLGRDVPQEESAGDDSVFRSLTPREREILALLARGLGNADIAGQLSLSEKTVRNHVSSIFDKLGVWSRAQAIVFARDRGFSG